MSISSINRFGVSCLHRLALMAAYDTFIICSCIMGSAESSISALVFLCCVCVCISVCLQRCTGGLGRVCGLRRDITHAPATGF